MIVLEGADEKMQEGAHAVSDAEDGDVRRSQRGQGGRQVTQLGKALLELRAYASSTFVMPEEQRIQT